MKSGLVAEMALALRPWSLTASVFPVLLTAAVTNTLCNREYAVKVCATLFMGIFVHFASNLANTYFDFRDGVDTKLHASDRTLVDAKLSKATVAFMAAFSLISAFCIAYFTIEPEPVLSILVGAGFLLGLSYTSPPLQLKYRGLGDIVIMGCFGPILMLSSAMVLTNGMDTLQAKEMQKEVFMLSIPVALVTEAILFVNNSRDIRTDKASGITTICTLMGFKRARVVYEAIIAAIYVSVLLVAMYQKNIWYMILPGLTLPIAVDNVRLFVDDRRLMIDAPERNAQFHMIFCLCLVVAAYIQNIL
mmetsp:Transcript_12389/g.24093  ORF Transcript_12389/g.24093 Transcript_12389/m.24093 type:complete len:304 (+) Transcript_12389:290-1201(+)|eukprot:CAMPEP_0171488796 /NCGR_PEP_ID=MMETSP0958-20121227/2402_1 /TAXON_ID=87120 /ORGANISM="Aurantiochytrium limacinum, Strain ATCCMYA-1381" /LENGTH=303 /DNA_ID=CAMNT_0012021941 /DNA_START=226 /DNA_END=1137 /DNA_ORIENTATION=-